MMMMMLMLMLMKVILMINLLLGAPGGGKSYEAVAFHVIPALAEGRKVITNLPLILEAFPPEQRRLLDVRLKTRKVAPVVDWKKAESMYKRFGMAAREPRFNPNAFANIEDYGVPVFNEETGLTLHLDPWRHPETGAGPLYVIDECHKPLPKQGTPVQVEEWFAEHRHGHCDVLLMTQSHGKINSAIKELVQVCYRVRKATHLGFSNRYIRKVLDGVGGTEMNESVRIYDSTFFKFYRSHTQSSAAGKELEAKDIKPIWKHWTFKGAALMAVLFVVVVSTNDMNILKPKIKPVARPVAASAAGGGVVVAPGAVKAVAVVPEPVAAVAVSSSSKGHPLAGLGLHIGGFVSGSSRSMYAFVASQNGQAVFSLSQSQLEDSGYSVRSMNPCIAELSFEAVKFYVTCDAPRVGVNPAANMPTKSS
jgi:zona occludens toxin